MKEKAMQELNAKRRAAAEAAYERYDFGYQVAAADGWLRYERGVNWIKNVYVENDEDPAAPSLKVVFTAVFKDEDSHELRDVYATLDGTPIGNLTGPLPTA